MNNFPNFKTVIEDGVETLYCENHGLEICDICRLDATMMNSFARMNHNRTEGINEKKDIREKAKAAGCAYSECPNKDSESTIKFSYCSNCKTVQYCSRECQTSDWPQHKGPCKQARPKVNINGVSTQGYILGSKLEYYVNGNQTGIICKIRQYVKSSNTYLLEDLNSAESFQVQANEVGPTDWMDSTQRVHKSVRGQQWKVLQGAELTNQGFLGEKPAHIFNSISFYPYGLGPYIETDIIQQYINDKPTLSYFRIIEVVLPKNYKKVTGSDHGVPMGSDGVKYNLSKEELKGYKYTLQPSPPYRLHSETFSINAAEVHDTSKWDVV